MALKRLFFDSRSNRWDEDPTELCHTRYSTDLERYTRYAWEIDRPSTQQPTVYASACRRPVGFDSESSSAIPDSITGSRSGNWATTDRFPPMASMVFLSVDRKRSLRCSRCDTILRDPKLLGLSNLRELARVPQFKQGHLLSDQRSGASLNVLPLERAQLLGCVVDIRSHVSSAQWIKPRRGCVDFARCAA